MTDAIVTSENENVMDPVQSSLLQRSTLLVVGSALLGLGAAMVVAGNFGYDPYSSAVVATSQRLGIGVTEASLAFNAVLIAATFFRIRPSLGGTIISPVILSFVMGFGVSMIGDVETLLVRILLVGCSLILASFGIVFYLTAQFGASPTDSFVLTIAGRRITYPVALTLTFAIFCTVAFIVGGVLPGVATAISLLFMGTTVEAARRISERFGLVGFPNNGADDVADVEVVEANIVLANA